MTVMNFKRYIVILLMFGAFLTAFAVKEGSVPVWYDEDAMTLTVPATDCRVDCQDVVVPQQTCQETACETCVHAVPDRSRFVDAMIRYLYLNGNYLSQLRTFEAYSSGSHGRGSQCALCLLATG